MLKKTITYIDYDGNQRTEDLYFNLNKAEIVEMEMSVSGGMRKLIEQIMSEQDNVKLMETFKSLILKSYGVKSPDGKRFIKSRELTEEFTQTEAYPELFVELLDAKKAVEFVEGIMPADLEALADEMEKNASASAE